MFELILLRVRDATAGARELIVSSLHAEDVRTSCLDPSFLHSGASMRQLSRRHLRADLHIPMLMREDTGSGRDMVLSRMRMMPKCSKSGE